jgi:hypothetical protein
MLELVMPDLIRHPVFSVDSGFRRNDGILDSCCRSKRNISDEDDPDVISIPTRPIISKIMRHASDVWGFAFFKSAMNS